MNKVSDEAEAKFRELLGRYQTPGMGIYDALVKMREDNFEMYSRFIYSYGQDKFGRKAKDWMDEITLEGVD